MIRYEAEYEQFWHVFDNQQGYGPSNKAIGNLAGLWVV